MNIEDYEFKASEIEWSSISEDSLTFVAFSGATCVDFILVRDDVIALAKHFKLTPEDIKD